MPDALPTASKSSPWPAVRRWVRSRQTGEFLKTMVVVVPLTVLIWIYAERSQAKLEPATVSIDFVPADQTLAATIIEPLNTPLSLDIEGTSSQLTQFKDDVSKRSVAGRLTVTLPANYVVEGDVTEVNVDAAFVLSSDPTFAGITIKKVAPTYLKVRLDKYVERELAVTLPTTGVPASVHQVVFDQPKAIVRGPRTAMDQNFFNPQIAVDVSGIETAMRTQGAHREELPLVVPAGKFTVRPKTVVVRFEVSTSDREIEVPSVPIVVQQPSAQVGRWIITFSRPPVVQNVKLRGTQALLERYQSRTVGGRQIEAELLPTAVLRITPDDVGRGDRTKNVDFIDLLPGVTYEGTYPVEFKVEEAVR